MELVADAFPLMRLVDGVVVVGTIGRSRVGSAEQLHHVLSAGGAHVLGVIANRVRSRRPLSYVADEPRAGKSPGSAPAAVSATDGPRHAARA